MSDDEGTGADALDRSAEIARVADAVYEAMGVADKKVAFGYERRPSSACGTQLGLPPGLEAGQAWYARQAYALGPGTYDYDALIDSAERHFAGGGWETTSYRKGERIRGLRAVKDDVGVLVSVPSLDVLVTAGPCAGVLSAYDATYVPEG